LRKYPHGHFDFAQDDLTAVTIKAAKGRDKQYKLADSGGLHLLVLPSGLRYWRMNYRYLGKYGTLAFGVWPDMDL
jgi:Arm DNA-binding domain